VRTEENFLTYENIFSYVRKFIFLRKKISPPSNVVFSPSARRKIFVRTEENFLPQENLFPCGRKFWRLPKKNFPPFEQKFCVVRKERNFRAHENKFPHMRKYFFLYAEILPLANPLGMRGVLEELTVGEESRGWIRVAPPSAGGRRGYLAGGRRICGLDEGT
jgi:hypothetical protein